MLTLTPMNTNANKDNDNDTDSSLRRSSRIRATGVAVRPAPQSSDSSSSSAAPKKKAKSRKRSTFQDVTNTTTSRKRPSSSEAEALFAPSPLKKIRKTSTKTAAVSTLDACTAVTPVAPLSKKAFRDSDSEPLLSARKSPVAESALAISSLPAGVANLYPSNAWLRPCACDDDHCSSQSQSHCFLNHYGKDYFQSLKDWETLYFPTTPAGDSESLSLDDTRSFGGASPSSSSTRSRGTPLGLVNYVIGSLAEEDDGGSSTTSATPLLDNQPHLTEKMRGVLVDWLIELSEEYHLSARTLHLTVVLLNRSLEGCDNDENKLLGGTTSQDDDSTATKGRRLVVDRDMFQCLGCACMWMASKMEEITSPSVDDFVYISADSYNKREITEMEMAVCGALQFRLWHVTPHDFCEEFLRASLLGGKKRFGCPVVESSLERSMVQYLLTLTLLPYEFVNVAPRKIAAAAVYLARVVLGIGEATAWSPTLEHYSGFAMWDLEDTVLTIHKYHAAAENSKLGNAFNKFKKEKYHHVALKTVPLEQDLGF